MASMSLVLVPFYNVKQKTVDKTVTRLVKVGDHKVGFFQGQLLV